MEQNNVIWGNKDTQKGTSALIIKVMNINTG
jgi:hypothetical protein